MNSGYLTARSISLRYASTLLSYVTSSFLCFTLNIHLCSCLGAQSCLTLCDPTNWAHQAPLSLEFFRQEHWSELPFSSPGNLPGPKIEHASQESPALQVDSLLLRHWRSPINIHYLISNLLKPCMSYFCLSISMYLYIQDNLLVVLVLLKNIH